MYRHFVSKITTLCPPSPQIHTWIRSVFDNSRLLDHSLHVAWDFVCWHRSQSSCWWKYGSPVRSKHKHRWLQICKSIADNLFNLYVCLSAYKYMCWSCKHTGTRITRAPVFTWLPGCNWSSWPLSALWYYMFSHCPDVSGCICENHKCVCVDACTIFFILMYIVWFELCSRSVLIREHTHVYIFQHTGLSNIVKFPSLYACVHIYTHYVGW